MRLLINQPGRNGDIIICLPIAKWYSSTHQVDWLCPQEYHSLFKYIDYCKPILKDSLIYDKVIDMSFGITPGTKLHEWWIKTQSQWQSFIIPKYIIAEVPLQERWNLLWNKNPDKAVSLYNKIINKYGMSYSVVQEHTWDYHINIPVKNKVLFEPIEDYSIFDWVIVLLRAKEIHCIDSVLCNFVEVLPPLLNVPKFYYNNRNVNTPYLKTLLVNNWRFV